MERLQKILQRSGVASRRKAGELILEGKVKVDGIVVLEPGTQVEENQEVTVEDQKLLTEEKVYFALNKPTGYLSTTKDPHKRRTIM
ncbi:MAG: S4 domain-containing protein, partial [Candidatus Izemoplasmatales bacterium]|nr:S4 domain-containing protein [Candidatus Izemoplasmatales bacterium]